MQKIASTHKMKTLSDLGFAEVSFFLKRFSLVLEIVPVKSKIPGSFWGDTEAGLIENTLYARCDTPIHSILHEAGHYICMTQERRENLHTNALGKTKGEFVEENATCYLQIILADEIENYGREKILSDMDEWGYSFRLGSTKQWFEKDSQDAQEWLLKHKLIDENKKYNFTLRE